jgi:hypothetical protein
MAKAFKDISFSKLGGMRTDKPISDFEPTEALYARNVRFRKSPQPARRRGGSKYGGTSATQMPDASDVLGLYDFHYGSAGQKFIEVNKESIYTETTAGLRSAAIWSTLTAGKTMHFTSFDDYCWMTNGTDKMLKYDGTTVTQASIDAPTVGTMTAIQRLTQAYTSISNANPAVGTATAHGLKTGDKIQLTTTGTLPTGLSLLTDYYIIRTGADTMNFCPTLADALAGTNKVATSGAGSGTHTWTLFPTTAGALTLLGTYSYVVTYYNSTTGQESQPFALANAVTITLTTTNAKVYLQDIPVSADANVTARRIYRTTANGSIYNAQLVTTITDNTTTVYLDVIADTSLGALIKLYLDPAPIFKKMVTHKNRGFGFSSYSSRLYFSVLFNLWYWPQGLVDLSATAKQYYIDINPDDGDFITNIISYNDELLVFKNNSIWVLGGFDETDFFVRKVEFRSAIGCVSSRGAEVADNWCYFIDANGIYRTNMQMIDYVGSPVEAFFDANTGLAIEKVVPQYLSNAIAHVDDRKPNNVVKFYLTCGSETHNNQCLVYDYKMGFWSYDTGYTATAVALRTASNLDYLMRGDSLGYVWDDEGQDGEGGLIYATATSGTATKLTDASQAWTTNYYAGAYIEILSGTSNGSREKIVSNTATEITVASWTNGTPDNTSVYTIGGIDYFYQLGWNNYGSSLYTKRLQFVKPRIEAGGSYSVTNYIGFDFNQSLEPLDPITVSSGAIWGSVVWGAFIWGGKLLFEKLIRTPASRIHTWNTFAIQHKPAGQQISLNGLDKIFQQKGYGIR